MRLVCHYGCHFTPRINCLSILPFSTPYFISKYEKIELKFTSRQDSPENESPNANSSKEGGPSMLSFAYYQQYFDVDTQQVKERLMWSFVPRPSKDTLTHYIRPTPDLYGS